MYATFDEAAANAPRSTRIGYDHRDVALGYRKEIGWNLAAFDRPVITRLREALGSNSVVLDFGGNIGLHYLAYRKHVEMERVRWIVWDLPQIVRVGRETCAGLANVSFVERIDDLPAAPIDVVLASGSLQYLDDPAQWLASLAARNGNPAHILVNRVPLYDGETFVTLQNAGAVCYPQRVFNRADFIRSIARLGYELADVWDDDVDSCRIPFHPERSIRACKGLYFRRR